MLRPLVLLLATTMTALALVGPAPATAAPRHPTCAQLRAGDYGMFSRAGDRAVGRVVASVAPRCRAHRLSEESVFARVRRGLGRVGRTHDEVTDSAVLEAVADALEHCGAVDHVEALDAIEPGT